MTYFKVIENGQAVDAGWMWLQWNARHQCLMSCEPRDAHYAQSYDRETVFRIGWLNPLPEGAPTYPTVEAKIIDAEEYAELIEILPDEPVPEPPEPEPDPEPTPEPEPEPDPERKMTVQEMRDAIAELISMTAKENIQRGSLFILHDKLYMAIDFIPRGAEVIPMRNCILKDINELNGGN